MLTMLRRQRAQASVELLAIVPIAAIVMFAGWQMVVAGHTWWKLHEAARIAARTQYVAAQRGDRVAGARRTRSQVNALLPHASGGLKFSAGGNVTVSARVPLVGPFAVGALTGPRLAVTSRMAP